MKKYTQRELHNEAFRDMLKSVGKGVGKVAWAGLKGAAKNVARHISPEAYGLAKSARDIYKGSRPGTAILKDYVLKTRGIPVYMSTVNEADIISGNINPMFQGKRKNANKMRLVFTSAGKEEDIGDGIVRIPFKANSGDYIAYIDKIDKDKQQILAIKEA